MRAARECAQGTRLGCLTVAVVLGGRAAGSTVDGYHSIEDICDS